MNKIFSFITRLNSKIKLLIFLLSILIGLFVVFARINTQKVKQLNILFIPDEIKIHDLLINIGFQENTKDQVYISAGFSLDSIKNDFSSIYIETDDFLEPIDNSLNKGYSDYHKLVEGGKNKEYIKYTSDNRGFIKTYTGEIFEKINSEINNSINLGFGYSPKWLEKLPKTSIVIHGLSNFNLNSIYPEPDKYNINAIVYENSDKIKTIFTQGIKLSAEHKLKKHSNQNWIFILGILIGALFSGVIELLIDYKKTRK